MDAPMIDVQDMQKVYRMGTQTVMAVRGVSFQIGRGEFVALMGPSGSGKSTLMNVLGGLDTPSAGQYWLNGVNVTAMTEAGLAQIRATQLGFVFQQYHLLARHTALRNVALPLVYRGIGRAARLERARMALELVGMGARLAHRPSELSGGQQQRVAIARALVGSPSVILADEPTGALDTRTSAEIMQLLRRLHREQGLTVVVVTHEPDVAAYADRMLVMRDGAIWSDGPVATPAA